MDAGRQGYWAYGGAWAGGDRLAEAAAEPVALAAAVPAAVAGGLGVLADYAEQVLQSCHEQAERVQPPPFVVARAMLPADRDAILNWLVRTCEVMRFHESVLFSAVLTLDRYCARVGQALPMEDVQRVLMAVICTVLKTTAVQDEVGDGRVTLRFLLIHLFGEARLNGIMLTELHLLQALDFRVTAPSVHEFLEAFLAGGGTETAARAARPVAALLLHLSLHEAAVHYGYPPAVLSAAAVHIALASAGAAEGAFRGLQAELVVTCTDIAPTAIAPVLQVCCTELHILWERYSEVGNRRHDAIQQKFMREQLPPPLPARLLPDPMAFTALDD